MFYSLTYISKAVRSMSEHDLNQILQKSVKWNQQHKITGMLLYIRSSLLHHKEGRFIQALEGNEIDVMEIFDKIKLDKRHFNVTQLSGSPIFIRNFENWSMGFKTLDEQEFLATPGRFDLNEDFLKYATSNPFNPSLDFLKQFYKLNLDSNKKFQDKS